MLRLFRLICGFILLALSTNYDNWTACAGVIPPPAEREIIPSCNGLPTCNLKSNEMLEVKCIANFVTDSPVNLELISDHKNTVPQKASGLRFALSTKQVFSSDHPSTLNCQLMDEHGISAIRTASVRVYISFQPTVKHPSSDGDTIHTTPSFDVLNSKLSFTINLFANPDPLYVSLSLNDLALQSDQFNYTITEVDNAKKYFEIKVAILNVTTLSSNATYDIKISNDQHASKFIIKLESQQITATTIDLWIWIVGAVVGLVVLFALLSSAYWKYFVRPKRVEIATKTQQEEDPSSLPLTTVENTSLTAAEWHPQYNIIYAVEVYQQLLNNSLTDNGWVLQKSGKCSDSFYVPFTVRLFYNNDKRQYLLVYDAQSTWLLRWEWYQSRVLDVAIEFAKDAVDQVIKNKPFPPLTIVGTNLGGTLAQAVTVDLKYSKTNFLAHCLAYDAPPVFNVVAHYLNSIDNVKCDITNFLTQESLALNKEEYLGTVVMHRMPENQPEVSGEENPTAPDVSIIQDCRLADDMIAFLKQLKENPPIKKSLSTENVLPISSNIYNSPEELSSVDSSVLQNETNENTQLLGMDFEICKEGFKLLHGITFEKFVPCVSFAMIVTPQRNAIVPKASFRGERTTVFSNRDERKLESSSNN